MWDLLNSDGAFPSDARRSYPGGVGGDQPLVRHELERGIAPVISLFADTEEEDTLLGWQERALCAQTDPEAFFPEKGGSTREAKRVCSGCEVRQECLEYALENDERFGIWGGLSERERRKLKRQAI
ncbi:transcription factor WhiB [Luteimicrobium subarcticum]|uniref:Transcriptional regulator WhiB n=1 Tax=Luteimicrobium subarcticum TaxID=620910 RepID=A0A2M8WTM2_9MICO|nr:transcription factor WhiB [Luteimicrobium subarcticum]